MEATKVTVANPAESYAKDVDVLFGFNAERERAKRGELFAKRHTGKQSDAAYMETVRAKHVTGVFVAKLFKGSAKLTAAMVTEVERVKALKGFKADAKGDDVNGRRTEEQERMYAAARQSWSRMLRDAGFETTENRGGKQKGDTAKQEPAKQEPAKQEAPTAPVSAPDTAKYTTVAHGHKYLQQCAATMLATLDKHAPAFDTNLRKMVEDFAKHVSAYVVAE